MSESVVMIHPLNLRVLVKHLKLELEFQHGRYSKLFKEELQEKIRIAYRKLRQEFPLDHYPGRLRSRRNRLIWSVVTFYVQTGLKCELTTAEIIEKYRAKRLTNHLKKKLTTKTLHAQRHSTHHFHSHHI